MCGVYGDGLVEVRFGFAIFFVAEFDITFVCESFGVIVFDVYTFGRVENVASYDG